MQHLEKHGDRINKKYAENTELYILWSELSRCKLSPTLASALTTLLGPNFLITTNVYVNQTLRTILINSILIQIETKNIKIAVETTNLCGKNMRCAHFAEICEKWGNIWNMWQSHIRVKLTCLVTDTVHGQILEAGDELRAADGSWQKAEAANEENRPSN